LDGASWDGEVGGKVEETGKLTHGGLISATNLGLLGQGCCARRRERFTKRFKRLKDSSDSSDSRTQATQATQGLKRLKDSSDSRTQATQAIHTETRRHRDTETQRHTHSLSHSFTRSHRRRFTHRATRLTDSARHRLTHTRPGLLRYRGGFSRTGACTGSASHSHTEGLEHVAHRGARARRTEGGQLGAAGGVSRGNI
jgi:hypothetical protein